MVARKQKHKGIIVGIGSMCVYIEIHNFAFQFCKVAKRAAISGRVGSGRASARREGGDEYNPNGCEGGVGDSGRVVVRMMTAMVLMVASDEDDDGGENAENAVADDPLVT